MTGVDRRLLSVVLAVLLGFIGWRYADTFATIVRKWEDDAAFSHGVLILPVSLWLVWRMRHEISMTPVAPSWWGPVAMALCVAAWVIAHGTGVLVVEQFAAVAMIPAVVLAVCGPRLTRQLAFPLAFLLFAVPFGRGLVPSLMQVSADIGTWALKATGIPVYRSHMLISIPAGQFEVARACSGLNYFVTGLVLGVLYAYLTYAGWKKRVLCVLAFIVTPIVMNGVRIYVIVTISHLTDMRFGPGTEHIVFGRLFFLAIMFAMFWLGWRWRDPPSAFSVAEPSATLAAAPTGRSWAVVPVVAALAFAGPHYLASFSSGAAAALSRADDIVALPVGTGGWSGPSTGPNAWRPHFKGAVAEWQGMYLAVDGKRIDVYVGLYGIGRTSGAEMISYGNRVFSAESGSLARSSVLDVSLPDGGSLTVRQFDGRTIGQPLIVWQWFVVGERRLSSPVAVKAWEVGALLTRDVTTARVVTIATPADQDAQARLESFIREHAACVGAGFAAEACRR